MIGALAIPRCSAAKLRGLNKGICSKFGFGDMRVDLADGLAGSQAATSESVGIYYWIFG